MGYHRVGEVSEKPTDLSTTDRSILVYGVAGEKATGRLQIGRFFTNFVDPIDQAVVTHDPVIRNACI
jgi:hypothetical protein